MMVGCELSGDVGVKGESSLEGSASKGCLERYINLSMWRACRF
jgi:hypothetical protein